MPDQEQHVTTTEARGGSNRHMVQYALVFGTGLTIIAFAVILLIAA